MDKKLLRVSHKHKRTHKNTTRLETVGNSTRLVLQAGAFPPSLSLFSPPFAFLFRNQRGKEGGGDEAGEEENNNTKASRKQRSPPPARHLPVLLLLLSTWTPLFYLHSNTRSRAAAASDIQLFFFHLVAVCSLLLLR